MGVHQAGAQAVLQHDNHVCVCGGGAGVGGVEALGLLAGHFRTGGIFWNAVRRLNNNFSALGYLIIAIFALSWIVSIAIYKWRRLDDLELGA